MYVVKYFKSAVYEYSPDLTAKFHTVEEARIFAKTITSTADECRSVKIEMEPEWYAPEDAEKEDEEC